MTRKTQHFRMPDYKTLIADQDAYITAWQDMAKPVEEALGLTLTGFDPGFLFRKGNPNGVSTVIDLPVWFVRDLNKVITGDKT
jgi:hypothetical protein